MKRKRLLMENVVPVLSWRKTARADLLAIVEYIADDNPDAAQALKDEIETRVSEVARFPQMYKLGRVAGTREMVVRPNFIVDTLKMQRACPYCACYMRHSSGRSLRGVKIHVPQGFLGLCGTC
jgi:toxin ParE1/3/4